jgi:hypothetical protein
MEVFSLTSKLLDISKFAMYTKKLSYISNGFVVFENILTQKDINILTQETTKIIKTFKKEAFPSRPYAFNDYTQLDSYYTNSINQITPFIAVEGFENGVLKKNYDNYIQSIGNGIYIISFA